MRLSMTAVCLLLHAFAARYGKVVQEYNAGETVKTIRTLGQKNKYAERTGEQVVLGVNVSAPPEDKNMLV